MPECTLPLYFGLYVLALTYPAGVAVQLRLSPQTKLLARELNVFKRWVAVREPCRPAWAVGEPACGTAREHRCRGIALASEVISRFQNCTSLFVPPKDNF